VAVAVVAACGSDEVSYSAPVGINLSVASGEVEAGQIVDEKNINTESGNPYAVFIADARDALGGDDPGDLRLDRAALEVMPSSSGVGELGAIFAGRVELRFEMNSTGTIVPAGWLDVAADTGAGPVEATIDFDASAVPDAEWASLVGGAFKVVLQGPAADGFADASADADLVATFELTALE
jgi:hypothetical protein